MEIHEAPMARHGERPQKGNEAWRATKAPFFGGGFLQRVGKSEPLPTQAACTRSFVKRSPGQ